MYLLQRNSAMEYLAIIYCYFEQEIMYHIFLQFRTPCSELPLHSDCPHKYSQCLQYRRAYGNEEKFFHYINLLKPTGYVMHHQFNIQQLYALPTLYLCVLYLSENK